MFAPTLNAESTCLMSRFLGGAEIVRNDEDGLLLRLENEGELVEAKNAVHAYRPNLGDKVLAIGDSDSGFYLIGVLETRSNIESVVKRDPISGKTQIVVDDGDLELVTKNGNVNIVSSDGVRATGLGPIDLNSATAVRMSIFSRLGGLLSKFKMSGHATELTTDRVDIESKKTALQSNAINLSSEKLKADTTHMDVNADKMNLITKLMRTTADNVYQKACGLWQVMAGRSRMVVDETSHHKAKRIYSKATNDVKVKAEQIHLG